MDNVVRDAGVVRVAPLQFFKNLGGLELLRISLVGGIGRLVERKRGEDRRLRIIGIAHRQARHCRLVIGGADLLWNARIVLIERGERFDPGALALGLL